MQGANIRFSPTELATPDLVSSFLPTPVPARDDERQWTTPIHLFLLSSLYLFFFPACCIYILFLKYFIFIPVLVSSLLAGIKKKKYPGKSSLRGKGSISAPSSGWLSICPPGSQGSRGQEQLAILHLRLGTESSEWMQASDQFPFSVWKV